MNFIEEIMAEKKKIKLTKNIAIISYLQLIFFISINIAYLFAIQNQLQSLQMDFANIQSIDGGLYSYSQTLYAEVFGIFANPNNNNQII